MFANIIFARRVNLSFIKEKHNWPFIKWKHIWKLAANVLMFFMIFFLKVIYFREFNIACGEEIFNLKFTNFFSISVFFYFCYSQVKLNLMFVIKNSISRMNIML